MWSDKWRGRVGSVNTAPSRSHQDLTLFEYEHPTITNVKNLPGDEAKKKVEMRWKMVHPYILHLSSSDLQK